MKIGIIGAGKVGCSMGKYLAEAGITVTGFYSKTRENAEIAADFSRTKSYRTIEDLIKASDTLFITTPDGVIGEIWDRIVRQNLQDKIICHFSGSLSSEIFYGIEKTGASACSIHPMYAFCDKFTSYKQLDTVPLTIEGQSRAVKEMENLFGQKLGHKTFVLLPENKMKYHTAAVLASNYIIGLMHMSMSLLKECGFSEEETGDILEPLAMDNLKTVLEKGSVAALTGPIERNDFETVSEHLRALGENDFSEAYKSVGKILISIAKCRSPERDYSSLEELMKTDIPRVPEMKETKES